MEFTQIDHEKYFKFVMRGLFILITVWNVLLFMLAEIIEPGALYARVGFLTGDMLVEQEYYLIILGNVVTGLAMVTAEICACVMKLRNASTIIHPVCSVEFIVNHIPFFTLNFSIVLVLVVQTVTVVFFEFRAPFWLNASVVLTTILVTNKGARAHVATRLRQQIDSFTIGGNNASHQASGFRDCSCPAQESRWTCSNTANPNKSWACSNTAHLNKSNSMPCRRMIVSKFITSCKITQKI